MKLPIASGRVVVRKLGAMLGAHRAQLAVTIVFQLGSALAVVALPALLGRVIDAIQAGTTREFIVQTLVGAVLMVVVAAILSYIAEYQARVLAERVFAELREEVVTSVTGLPLSAVESAGTGDLLGRATHDVERVQYLVRQGISAILVLVTTIVSTIVAAMLISPLLACVLLLQLPFAWAVVRWYLPRTVPSYRAGSVTWAEVSGAASETVDQAETVDSQRLGDQRVARMDQVFNEMWRLERYGAWMRVFMIGGLTLATIAPVLAVVLVGAWALPHGWVTLGAVSSVALYAVQLRGPLWETTFWIDQIQVSQVSLARIFGISLVPADRVAGADRPSGHAIAARDVRYAYREGVDVLHDVTLDLVVGETLAMVGPSGAGKSTFGRMLAGIHPPTGGSVTVGGVEMTSLPEDVLLGEVVLVSQEHHVFVGTLASNLRLVAPEASDDAVRAALAAVGAAGPAGAGGWVDALPDGLDTAVGAGGIELSAAQAQQVALARIVLMDPATLVLDEATSLMDPTAARSLERALGRVLEGRTVVAIAHRLHTAHDADRVAVMRDGRIVELGTHEELVGRGGEYASLWESWQSE